MSTEVVVQIIGRAVVEPDFRELMFADPANALNGCDLTTEEAAALKSISREQFDAVESELRDRMEWARLLYEADFSSEARDTFANKLDGLFDFD